LNGNFPNVVVTSLAATTSIAGDVDATWKGLLNGESGIDTLEDSFVEEYGLPVRIGGHLKVRPETLLSRVECRRMAYVEQLATVLGREVWKNAGTPEVDPERLGVAIGTGLGGGDALIDSVDKLKNGGYRKISPLAVQMVMPNGPSAVVGLELKARAGVVTPVSACSSGSEAIANAWRMIVMGDADIVVTGGVEGYIDAVPIAAFSMMRAMSTRNDDPAPDGQGAARAITRAMQTAGLTQKDITHVNAHATATPIGDTAEANAINLALGSYANQASVYAPKSALGHSIGAVGALESVLTVLSIRDGIVPPTLNLENQDPEIDLDVVHGEARRQDIEYAINNSFGFGGHNVALAFGRY
jgi:beta-ketoacyl ACP synthase